MGDLTQCVEGKWTVKAFGNDSVEIVMDESMAVLNRQCVVTGSNTKDDNTNDKTSMSAFIAIASVVAFIVIGIAIVVAFFYYRSKKSKAPKVLQVKDEEEIEVDVDVEEKINNT